jgi:hypothetical protein
MSTVIRHIDEHQIVAYLLALIVFYRTIINILLKKGYSLFLSIDTNSERPAAGILLGIKKIVFAVDSEMILYCVFRSPEDVSSRIHILLASVYLH